MFTQVHKFDDQIFARAYFIICNFVFINSLQLYPLRSTFSLEMNTGCLYFVCQHLLHIFPFFPQPLRTEAEIRCWNINNQTGQKGNIKPASCLAKLARWRRHPPDDYSLTNSACKQCIRTECPFGKFIFINILSHCLDGAASASTWDPADSFHERKCLTSSRVLWCRTFLYEIYFSICPRTVRLH